MKWEGERAMVARKHTREQKEGNWATVACLSAKQGLGIYMIKSVMILLRAKPVPPRIPVKP